MLSVGQHSGHLVVPWCATELTSLVASCWVANDTFTVKEAGRYKISYAVHITEALFTGTYLMIESTSTNYEALPLRESWTSFAGEILLDLEAGDDVSLWVYGVSTVTLLPQSVGAFVSMVRLS